MPRTPHGHWDEQQPIRRALRTSGTAEEDRLWQCLRSRRLSGARFRRQHPIEHFIVDFYCVEADLAIEIDGGVHARQQEADALRQAYIEGVGVRVLRFTNAEIRGDIAVVLATIAKHLD